MLISSSYFFVLPSFFLFFFLPFLLPSFFLLFFAFVKLLYSVFLLIFFMYIDFDFCSFLSLSPFRYNASLSPSFPFFSSNSLHPHSIAARRKIGLGFGKWVWKNVGAPLFTIYHAMHGHCINRRHSYFFLFVVKVLTPINKITPNFLFQLE